MRYTFIEGFEEIIAGAHGTPKTGAEVEGEVKDMGNALTEFFTVISALINALKSWRAGT